MAMIDMLITEGNRLDNDTKKLTKKVSNLQHH